jgi:DNA (cytosine-5)-methyltransferase 1
LDLGFVHAGFRCVAAIDIDEKALAVHQANIESPALACDLSTGALPLALNVPPDLVLSGSPCQGFSTIGKREPDDLRNKLLLRGAEIAVGLGARIFVAENVPAVTAGSHRRYWEQLREYLKSNGYGATTLTLLASDFGVAQMRKRLFLVAVRGATSVLLSPSQLAKKTLRDVIGDLVAPDLRVPNHDPIALPESGSDWAIARRIKQGQKLCNVRGSDRAVHTWQIPEVFGPTSPQEQSVLQALLRLRRRERLRNYGDADPVPIVSLNRYLERDACHDVGSLLAKNYLRRSGSHIDFTHTFNGKYRRLQWDGVSHTVDTRFGSARNFLHPEKHRSFTVREAARIQGFPDTFTFSGSIHDQFRFVGNAVPPPMARALATSVLALVKT